MTISFVFEIILMASLGAMIYLVARAVPRVNDTVLDEGSINKGLGERFGKFIDSLPIEKADLTISRILERALRNLKLLVMRVDNKLSQHLTKFKAKIMNGEQNGKKPTLFSVSNEDKENGNNSDISPAEELLKETSDLEKNKKEAEDI
ncbi:MAG: hypothetical protein NUV83_01050 [Candidatus Wolfebacteria bacterium]|nr:hypothetical protein [Candidatus Wolfebacteria bacterium]